MNFLGFTQQKQPYFKLSILQSHLIQENEFN